MSALKQRHHDHQTARRELELNPTCEFPRCGAPCFSFGPPMFNRVVNVCGVHATGPAADWYSRRRAAA